MAKHIYTKAALKVLANLPIELWEDWKEGKSSEEINYVTKQMGKVLLWHPHEETYDYED